MNEKSKSTLEKYKQYLRFKNYSINTIDTYVNYANKFLLEFNKDIYHISQKEAESFLINKKYTSISQQNQYINAIKLLYKYVVKSNLNNFNIERPKKNKKLPIVLSQDEIQRMFDVCTNTKHKTILALLYSTGMRANELINLKWQHIDRSRMIINIIGGKGNKDRQVMLAPELIPLLEKYWHEYKSKDYVLNGQTSTQYSKTSVLQVVKQLANTANISKRTYTHLIRHCAFTHAVENGVDINILQKIAGHNNVKTTMIYTHISDSLISKVKSPISSLKL